MKTFLEAMNNEPPNYEEALACLNSAQQDAKSWELVGTNMADKLVYVMDRIKYVVYQEIPDTPDGQPYTWYTSAAGNIVIARVEEGEAKGEWRFTPQTLNNIEALYRANEDKPLVLQLREAGKTDRVPWRLWLRSKVPDWLKDGTMLGVSEWQWIGIALLFLLGWGVRKAVAFLATMLISPWLHRWKIRIEWARRRAAVGPVGTIALGGFWYAGLQFLDLPPAWWLCSCR
jgi:MscS family membrane protein